MPYIEKHHKKYLDPLIKDLVGYIGRGEGKLNYTITKLCLGILPTRYRDFNAIVGILECVKQEFYRRAIVEYENKKIKENGDVYV